MRRALYLFAFAAPAWGLLAVLTGGVGWRLGPIRISSRDPLRPMMVGLAAAALYTWLAPRIARESDGRWLERGCRRLIPILPLLLVVCGFGIGVRNGSFAAAGSDSYGYVSQASLWREGSLHVTQPIVEQFAWPHRGWIFSPLGYRPTSDDSSTIVPTYPPGLPILMAVFLAIIGSNGPFYVVPVLGALALWFTYLLGRDATGSRAVGAAAAAVLLASPVFLAHLSLPMTDVPVAAGWTIACWLAVKQPEPRPLAAGLVAGATLLIRPNLVLLAAAPVAAWLWPAIRNRSQARERARDVVMFMLGLLPAVVAELVLNARLYGSALASGYGTLTDIYDLHRGFRNFQRYSSWLVRSQTPLIAIALVPLVTRSSFRKDNERSSARAAIFTLVAATFMSYLFYEEFDVWFYVRYLLPALPVMFIMLAAGIRSFALALPFPARWPVGILLVLASCTYPLKFARDQFIFNQRAFERRYVRAAEFVLEHTPPTAIVLAAQHSGSVRYYSHRLTLRYDALSNDRLDETLKELSGKGYHPYLVLDDFEQQDFRTRFAETNRAGKLDWTPLTLVTSDPRVYIYDLDAASDRR